MISARTLQEKVISFARITVLDEDFLRVDVNPGAEVDIQQLEEIWSAYEELLGKDKKFYLLTILPFDMHHNSETRKYWARTERSKRKIAEAFVVSGLALSIVANFVTRVEKPAHEVTYFHSEEKAMKWLEAIRARNRAQEGCN